VEYGPVARTMPLEGSSPQVRKSTSLRNDNTLSFHTWISCTPSVAQRANAPALLRSSEVHTVSLYCRRHWEADESQLQRESLSHIGAEPSPNAHENRAL